MAETYSTPAEAHASNPPAASAETVPVLYIDTRTGEQLPANATATVNEASDDLTAFRASEADSRSLSISADFAEAIDRMRAEGVRIDEVPGVAAAAAERAAAAEDGDSHGHKVSRRRAVVLSHRATG